jgi:hypothetical protein
MRSPEAEGIAISSRGSKGSLAGAPFIRALVDKRKAQSKPHKRDLEDGHRGS